MRNLAIVLTIVLVLGSSHLVSAGVSSSSSNSVSKPDLKKPAKVNSKGFNNVVKSPVSPPVNYDEYDEYTSQEEMDHEQNLDSNDRHYLDPKDRDSLEEHQTPEMAKCCAIGEALNSEGKCHKLDKDYKHDRAWYPDLMYIMKSAKFVPVNLTAWNVVLGREIDCEVNQSAQVVSNLEEFVMLADGRLSLTHHHRHIDPLDFCFDQQIGKAGAGRAIKACFTNEELKGIASS